MDSGQLLVQRGMANEPSELPAGHGSNYSNSGITNSVVSQGIDPISGLNTVYSGNYSAKANDSNNNYSVSV